MKNIFIFFIFSLILSFNSFGQNIYDEINLSFTNLFQFIGQTVNGNRHYEYLTSGNPFYGGKVSAGNKIAMELQLQKDIQYVFMAGTSRDKVDLILYRGKGDNKQRIEIRKIQRAALITRFDVQVTGDYTIELINLSQSSAFLTMLALQVKDHASFSVDSLRGALSNLRKTLEKKDSSKFLNVNNVISFFGNTVPQGRQVNLNSLLPRGNFKLLAEGDISITNIDAFVFVVNEVDPLSRNSGQSSRTDFADFSITTDKMLTFRIINKNSRNNTGFIIGFVVQVP